MKKYLLFLISISFCFATKIYSQNLSLGLVACYPFSGNANYMSGNNHNGIAIWLVKLRFVFIKGGQKFKNKLTAKDTKKNTEFAKH